VRLNVRAPKWVVAVTGVAVVVALTAAGMAVAGSMGGGGSQPEDVLPANAMAFVKLDLNPAAGQKLAVYRLAPKFPKVKGKVTSEETSIKESGFGSVFTGNGKDDVTGLDYKKDVEPWLGDRIGVGVFPALPGSKDPQVGLAIAFTDHDKAKAALDKAAALSAKDASTPSLKGYAFTEDGYVIVSDTTAHAAAIVAAGKAKPLAKSAYARDVETLGGDQIGVAWADIAAVYKAVPKDKTPAALNGLLQGPLKGVGDPTNISGRIVIGLHADPAFLEVTAKAISLKGANTKGISSPVKDPATGAAMIGSFPSEVSAAVTLTGLSQAVGALYTTFTRDGDPFQVKATLAQMGISSAKEIETLLGSETGVMVAGTLPDSPEFAVRTRGTDPDGALTIARRLLASSGATGVTAGKITGPDGIVVTMGTSPAVPGGAADLSVSLLNKTGSTLGDTPAFKQVLPDSGNASFAAFVNLPKVVPSATDNPAATASLKPFNALGVSVSGGTEPTVRIRVSVR